MNELISLQEWLRVLAEATQEVSATALRFDGRPPVEVPGSRGARPGAYIAILCDSASMHVGLTTSPEGCRTLARGLLGMRESVELADKEVVDAVSELLNIVAGKVKSRLAERDTSLRLGLPLFVQAEIQITEHMERATADVKVGPVGCQLQVYRNPRAMQAREAA